MSKMKVVIISAVFLGLAVFVVMHYPSAISTNSVSLEEHANKILEKCSAESSPGSRRTCYESEVPKLVGVISLEGALKITELIQEKDDTYLWCHNMAHQISEREYEKDPSRWKDIMTRCPVGTCANGCIHGAIQAHFRAASVAGAQFEELMPDLENLCEERDDWRPTGLEQSSCYHELGHLSLYLADSDIQGAAEVCQRVAVKNDGRNFVQTCNEGIFMQVFEPREPEDFELAYSLIPLKEVLPSCENLEGEAKGACWERGWGGSAAFFCNQFSGETKSACMREAWVVYDKEKIKTPQGVIEYCSYSQDPSEKRKCYNTLFYSLMSLFEFDEERMKKLCVGLSKEVIGQCFANTASRMVETDKDLMERAVAVCEYAKNFGGEEKCYGELLYYSSFSLHPGSKEFIQYCSYLPAPWNTKCIQQ